MVLVGLWVSLLAISALYDHLNSGGFETVSCNTFRRFTIVIHDCLYSLLLSAFNSIANTWPQHSRNSDSNILKALSAPNIDSKKSDSVWMSAQNICLNSVNTNRTLAEHHSDSLNSFSPNSDSISGRANAELRRDSRFLAFNVLLVVWVTAARSGSISSMATLWASHGLGCVAPKECLTLSTLWVALNRTQLHSIAMTCVELVYRVIKNQKNKFICYWLRNDW